MDKLQHGWVLAASILVIALTGRLLAQTPDDGRGFPVENRPLVSGAWVTRLEGGASSRATPVVKDGILYLTAGANVFAIDAKTGDPVWRCHPDSSRGWTQIGK